MIDCPKREPPGFQPKNQNSSGRLFTWVLILASGKLIAGKKPACPTQPWLAVYARIMAFAVLLLLFQDWDNTFTHG